MSSSPDQVVYVSKINKNILLWDGEIYIYSIDLSFYSIEDVIDHWNVDKCFGHLVSLIDDTFMMFLDSSGIVWNIQILMGTNKCDFFEPLHSFFLGELV